MTTQIVTLSNGAFTLHQFPHKHADGTAERWSLFFDKVGVLMTAERTFVGQARTGKQRKLTRKDKARFAQVGRTHLASLKESMK